MGKKEDNFVVGALVFARVKGYAPWPAKITKAEPKKKKYYVYFYGTGEASHAMKPDDLYEYLENKAQFVNDKNLKRKFYKEAVEQIEAALRGEEDVASINNTSTAAVTDESQLEETNTSSIPEQTITSETDGTSNEISVPVTPTSQVEKPARKSGKQSKTNTSTPAERKSPKPRNEPTPVEPVPEIEPLVSRSGRKIKPKRYLEMEMEENVSPVPKKRNTITEDTPAADINTNIEKPTVKLENSPNPAKKKSGKDFILKLESNLIELDHLIKASVGLNSANPDKCIEHLNEYKALEITPLMLKKHPGCVETMKRLRRYVGNAKNWEMNETLKAEFDLKARQIRERAEDIYSSFKRMFHSSEQEGRPFWEFFSAQVEKFKEKTKHLEQNEVFELVEEPEDENSNPKNTEPVKGDDNPSTSPISTSPQQTESNGGTVV